MHDGFDSSRIDYSGQFTERSAFRVSIPKATSDIHLGNTNCINRVKRMDIEDLEIEIQVLVARGVKAPSAGERRKVTNDLIRLLTKHKLLFHRSGVKPSCFEEAWTKMLDTFYLNLWEKTTQNTERAYCDSEGKIVYRLKTYLKYRIQEAEQKARIDEHLSIDAIVGGENDNTTLLDRLPADKISPLDDVSEPFIAKIARFRELVIADSTGVLKELHVRNHPDVNCQAITLLRFAGVAWKDIAEKLETTIPTASGFFEGRCQKTSECKCQKNTRCTGNPKCKCGCPCLSKCMNLLKELYGEDLEF
jgi:hypothetical protein